MPTYTLSFRGICLFVVNNNSLQEVLLADADRSRSRESKRDERHVDDTIARKHYAYFWAPDVDDARIDISECTVIVNSENGPLPPAASLGNLPQLPNDELLLDQFAPYAKVRVNGGNLTTEKSDGRAFSFMGQQDRHDQVNIEFGQPVTVSIVKNSTVIKTLVFDSPQDRTFYIYNFDEKKPKTTELETGKKVSDAVILDHDFKWHFLIAMPRANENDPNKLEIWCQGVLPCPVAVRPPRTGDDGMVGSLTVAGSTCYPAAYTET